MRIADIRCLIFDRSREQEFNPQILNTRDLYVNDVPADVAQADVAHIVDKWREIGVVE